MQDQQQESFQDLIDKKNYFNHLYKIQIIGNILKNNQRNVLERYFSRFYQNVQNANLHAYLEQKANIMNKLQDTDVALDELND